jgi:uncharacterized protein (TIGR02001 family)
MTKTILVSAIALAAAAFAGTASAEGATVSYNIGVTNDYVFRGVTQNGGDAALQGGIDVSEGKFYGGVWASNVDFADREVDLYAGYKPTYGKFSFDLGALYYNYNDPALDTTELKAVVSHPFYKGTVGFGVYDNIDFGKTFYYEVNASYPLTDKLGVSGALGEQSLGGAKYSTGNIGLTYAITSHYSVDVRYSDTNIPESIKASKPRVAVLLKAAF